MIFHSSVGEEAGGGAIGLMQFGHTVGTWVVCSV
ncbi:hypothetical protein [Veronia nyctiphanis]